MPRRNARRPDFDAAILEALGAGWRTTGELAEILGWSRTEVNNRMRPLRWEGRIRQVKSGTEVVWARALFYDQEGQDGQSPKAKGAA